jgi:hypothetical protein
MKNASARRAIVDRIIQLLDDNDVTDAAHYFKNPFREIDPEELPAIKVAIMRGTSQRENSQPEYSHADELVVAYIAQENDDLADMLNYYAERIEDFLIQKEAAGALSDVLNDLTSAEFTLALEKAEIGTGAGILKFNISYWTKHTVPLGPLEGFEVAIKPSDAPPADDPIFTESIDLPQP